MTEPAILFIRQLLKHCLRGRPAVLGQTRYYSRWRASLQPGRSAVGDRCPWLSFPAIDFLEKNLASVATVFEYGSGGSTLFFLEKGARVITVEHDSGWYSRLLQEIPVSYKARWEGHLLPPEPATGSGNLDKARPEDYYSGVPSFSKSVFRQYARFISSFPDGSFDLVLVDGRARSSCLFHAIPKVRQGGWLILDNSERPHYLINNPGIRTPMFRPVVDTLGAVPYDPYFSRTTIWERI